MKINGVEIDMKKVVEIYEKETGIKYGKTKRKFSTKEYWASEAGQIRKLQMSEELTRKHASDNPPHRQKIKYEAEHTETHEKTIITGQKELANFLGYKNFNSDMRSQMTNTGVMNDRTRKNYYNIKEII